MPPDSRTTMLPVSIIAGYLGAGKTTLVNALLRNANGTRIAVLVNEFGALPIDADLIEAQDDRLISIAGGCVCCSYGNDLIQALLDLAKLDMPPDHLVIECSGVALPGAIAASVSLMDGFQVDGIVVVVDGETIITQSDDPYMGDTITRQLSDANIVLVNKSDLLTDTQRDAVQSHLAICAPDAEQVATQYAAVPNSVVLQSFDLSDAAFETAHVHAPDFETRAIDMPNVCDADHIARILAAPETGLIRAKGFVRTANGPRAVQVVARRWAVSEAPDSVRFGLVVIAAKGHGRLSEIEAQFHARVPAA